MRPPLSSMSWRMFCITLWVCVDRIAGRRFCGGVEVLRALAAQEDHGAAGDDGLGEVVVELLLGVGVLVLKRADAAVGHRQAPEPAPRGSGRSRRSAARGG